MVDLLLGFFRHWALLLLLFSLSHAMAAPKVPMTNQSIISSVAPFSSVLCFHLFILLFGHLLLIASDHLGDGFQTLQSGCGQVCRPRYGRTKGRLKRPSKTLPAGTKICSQQRAAICHLQYFASKPLLLMNLICEQNLPSLLQGTSNEAACPSLTPPTIVVIYSL